MKCQCKELKKSIDKLYDVHFHAYRRDMNLDISIKDMHKLAHKYDVKKEDEKRLKVNDKNWRNIWRRFKELTTFNTCDWEQQKVNIQAYVGDEFRARLDWIDIWKKFDKKLNELVDSSKIARFYNTVSWVTQQKLIRKLIEEQLISRCNAKEWK
jgi:hypothetical protein